MVLGHSRDSFCRLTGFPAVQPEWGYGFWKSRDVHEHQDDVIRQRYVQLGELVGSLRVITSGLKPDDRVVVGELWRATPGTKVTPQLTTIGG